MFADLCVKDSIFPDDTVMRLKFKLFFFTPLYSNYLVTLNYSRMAIHVSKINPISTFALKHYPGPGIKTLL